MSSAVTRRKWRERMKITSTVEHGAHLNDVPRINGRLAYQVVLTSCRPLKADERVQPEERIKKEKEGASTWTHQKRTTKKH
jgi:hypothetical protein